MPPPSLDLRTLSHTLEARLAERLQLFAFEARISESAVLEHAVRALLASGTDAELAARIRAAGFGLRRKTANRRE